MSRGPPPKMGLFSDDENGGLQLNTKPLASTLLLQHSAIRPEMVTFRIHFSPSLIIVTLIHPAVHPYPQPCL